MTDFTGQDLDGYTASWESYGDIALNNSCVTAFGFWNL
jgi:hypothetical protein